MRTKSRTDVGPLDVKVGDRTVSVEVLADGSVSAPPLTIAEHDALGRRLGSLADPAEAGTGTEGA